MIDKNKRMLNVIWTVSNNYNTEHNEYFFPLNFPKEFSIYFWGLEGICTNFLDFRKLYKKLSPLLNIDGKFSIRHKIFELLLIEGFTNEMLQLRPGLNDSYNGYIHHLYNIHKKKLIKTQIDELEYNYACKKLNKNSNSSKFTEFLTSSILNIKRNPNTDDIIGFFFNIYRMHNYIVQDIDNELIEEDYQMQKLSRNNYKNETKTDSKGDNFFDDEIIQSAEFTDFTFNIDKALAKNPEYNSLENISFNASIGPEKTLSEMYGKSILNNRIQSIIENKICTGIHKECHLHFTKGELVESISAKYYKKNRSESSQENINFYMEKEIINEQQIESLSQLLRSKIITNNEDYNTKSRSGKIMPANIYRYTILKDDKIFNKYSKDIFGNFSVDILIDSSASQSQNKEKVASQAYIICQALSKLNIPVRVVSFSNMFNYTILYFIRDYNDTKEKNKNVFNYYTSGSNRDGLAIKTLCYLIDKNQYDKKLLIILSDGRPNNVINLNLDGNQTFKTKDYTGNLALKDTAKEVFLGRMKNINILGIFTGDEADLENEKFIYGSNFAYIKDHSQFSKIIATYIYVTLNK